MCGRFSFDPSSDPAEVLYRFFGVSTDLELEAHYNIAPSQEVPCVRLDREGDHELALLRWGLIPYWADDPAIGYKTINARAESVAGKPAFREAFRRRRCLVLADGFYEWQKRNGKQPYRVTLSSGEPFAMAGLWESWRPRDPGDEGGDSESPRVQTCTIITTDSNELVEPIHDRMPVILPRDAYEDWLDPDRRTPEDAQELLRPFPAEEMHAYAVSRMVNDPKNDTPEVIQPLEAAGRRRPPGAADRAAAMGDEKERRVAEEPDAEPAGTDAQQRLF